MSVGANLNSIKSSLPQGVRLVAVTKTKPAEIIMEAYNSGHRVFGENRVQELIAKKNILPADIEWHLIGHLQSNKVKYIVPFISLIESVDSYRLLKLIDKEAVKAGRIVDCLMQIHIASEDTKYGFGMPEIREMFEDSEFNTLTNIRLRGVMGMASLTSDLARVRSEFRQLRKWFEEIKENYIVGDKGEFNEISMGMSDDYRIALEEGSTIVRIGSLIFGER